MKLRVLIGCAAALGLVLTGCGSGGSVHATKPASASTSASAAPTSKGPSTSSSESASPEAESWTMPDLRGKNLQEAQDEIQELTGNPLRHSGSTDLSGEDRHQILDKDWQVCTSTPAPGETFTEDTDIDFGVVKTSETCPES